MSTAAQLLFSIDEADLPRLSGLRPSLWICSGPEISREDLKKQLLDRGMPFVGAAFMDPEALCARILGVDSSRILGPLSRREGLRLLLADRRVLGPLNETKHLRRQRRFVQRLDRALQAGRMAFAHPDEGRILRARLEERLGRNPLRSEIEFLGAIYEAWLASAEVWDLPRLASEAAIRLSEGWPEGVPRPEEIHVFSLHPSEGRLAALYEALAKHVQLTWVSPAAAHVIEAPVSWKWQAWHTWDDAAEAVADHWASPQADWDKDVILIPGETQIRRVLLSALKQRGIPLADPRDPDEARQSEAIKSALLPLRMVVSRFERESVVAFLLHAQGADLKRNAPSFTREIYERGVQDGLGSYAGGRLTELHRVLSEWGRKLSGKKRLEDLAKLHMEFLQNWDPKEGAAAFFAKFWQEWMDDLKLIGEGRKRAPLRYWWERLQDRLAGSQVPVRRVRPVRGARVYRFTQAPAFSPGQRVRLWVFGLSADALDAPSGDYWFSSREREILSADFSVRSPFSAREERVHALREWLAAAESVAWMDARFEADGRERENDLAVMREMPGFNLEEPENRGAHPRWLPSYGGIRPMPPQLIQLDPQPGLLAGADAPEKLSIEATELDHLSRCPFQALGYDRWKLRDLEEPDIELPPHVRGTLLHLAVELLIRSRSPQGVWGLSPREALEQAWKSRLNFGMLTGLRLEGYVKDTLVEILEKFIEEEERYRARSQARALSLENDVKLEVEWPEARVRGRPDRIDEHADGIFVMDYKSGSSVPSGRKMLEDSYRLQLAFYAVAAERKFKRPALGAQFITLTPSGGRSKGVFFPAWNGKEPGKLTQVTRANSSLFDKPPEDIWPQFEAKIRAVLAERAKGTYRVGPQDPMTECRACGFHDCCGKSRKIEEGDPEEFGPVSQPAPQRG